MIRWKTISDIEAKEAIGRREFSDAVRSSSEKTAVVLTQSWCRQWLELKRGLESVSSSITDDIDVHVFIYDRSPLFDEFLEFKEQVLGNDLIPYVRYYRNGRLIADSNSLPIEEFLRFFN